MNAATQLTRRQRGTAGIEVLGLGVLVLIFGTLMVANTWAVVDAKLAATAAAREAARAAVEASSDATAQSDATVAATAALTGMGRTNVAQVEVSGTFGRCERLVATVRMQVRAIVVPGIAQHFATFHVQASHSEVVDPYRSGLNGVADCPT